MLQLWHQNIGEYLNKDLLVVANNLWCQNSEGRLVCFRAADGEIAYDGSPLGERSTVHPMFNRLLLTSLYRDGVFICVDTFELNFFRPFSENWHRVSRPLLSGNMLLCAEGEGNPMDRGQTTVAIFALDCGGNQCERVILPRGAHFVDPFPPHSLLSSNADSTELLVHRYGNGWNTTSIEATGQTVGAAHEGLGRTYLLMRGGLRRVFDSETLEEINRRQIIASGKLLAHDDRVYISCRNRVVICDTDLNEIVLELDCKDPRRDSGIQGRACIVGPRMVCFGSNNKRLWCFDRYSGELLETIKYPDFISATPVLDGERLYVCCLDGGVYCYDATPYLS